MSRPEIAPFVENAFEPQEVADKILWPWLDQQTGIYDYKYRAADSDDFNREQPFTDERGSYFINFNAYRKYRPQKRANLAVDGGGDEGKMVIDLRVETDSTGFARQAIINLARAACHEIRPIADKKLYVSTVSRHYFDAADEYCLKRHCSVQTEDGALTWVKTEDPNETAAIHTLNDTSRLRPKLYRPDLEELAFGLKIIGADDLALQTLHEWINA